MSGTALFLVLVGVGYLATLPFAIVDRIEGKARRWRKASTRDAAGRDLQPYTGKSPRMRGLA